MQTFERLVDQLDQLENRVARRCLVPNIQSISSGIVPDVGSGAYLVARPIVARALDRHVPLIAVAMKNSAHLEQLAETLHERFYAQLETRREPFHLLVIDDEADDASTIGDGVRLDPLRDILERRQFLAV